MGPTPVNLVAPPKGTVCEADGHPFDPDFANHCPE
jgi:hypothetical protein